MRGIKTILTLTLCIAFAGVVAAQTTTQDVTINVNEVNALSVSGNVTMTINSATAGADLDNATDASTTYAITTNGTSKKITGELGAEYSAGITLEVTLAAPTGATSLGKQSLTGTAGGSPVDLVNTISQLKGSALTVSYEASATLAVAAGTSETETVTYTITNM